VSARASTQGAGRRQQRATRPAARPRREQPLEHRILVTATLCLIAFGAVMVYSASSGPALLAHQGDGTGALLKYLSFAGIGLLLMHVLARAGLEPVRRATPLLLAVCFGLLLWKAWHRGSIPPQSRRIYAAALVTAAALVVYGAFLGGRLVYGFGVGTLTTVP